jgi:hypothetical protein
MASESAGDRITIKFKSEAICGIGDADYLKGARSPLVVSLEPLDAKASVVGAYREINYSDISSGKKFVIDKPFSGPFNHYGLFICSRASRSKRPCRFMQPLALNDGTRVLESKDAKGRPVDQTFFFQYLFIDNGRATVFTKHNTYKTFMREVKSLASRTVSKRVAKIVVKRVRSLVDALGSSPLAINRDGKSAELVVNLPHHDINKCANVRLSQVKRLKNIPEDKIPRPAMPKSLPAH